MGLRNEVYSTREDMSYTRNNSTVTELKEHKLVIGLTCSPFVWVSC